MSAAGDDPDVQSVQPKSPGVSESTPGCYHLLLRLDIAQLPAMYKYVVPEMSYWRS